MGHFPCQITKGQVHGPHIMMRENQIIWLMIHTHMVKTFIRVHLKEITRTGNFKITDPTEMVRQARVPVGYTDILYIYIHV